MQKFVGEIDHDVLAVADDEMAGVGEGADIGEFHVEGVANGL